MPTLSTIGSTAIRAYGAFHASSAPAPTTIAVNYDASPNHFGITNNGVVGATNFGPFVTYPGSGTFSGAQWMEAGAASNWTWMHDRSSDFTVDGWIYLNSGGSSMILSDQANTINGSYGFNLYVNSDNTLGVKMPNGFDGGGTQDQPTWNSTGALSTGSWNYFCVTFTASSGVMTFKINGAAAGSGTSTNTNPPVWGSGAAQFPMNIGRYISSVSGSGSYLNGYLSNLRISNTIRSGAVPTAPFVSDANTYLLTSQVVV
jgi:hypothetical protein